MNLNSTSEKCKVVPDLRIDSTPRARWLSLATPISNSHFRRYSHSDIPQELDEHTKASLLNPEDTCNQSHREITEKCEIATASNEKDKILKKFSISENCGSGMDRKRKYKSVRFRSSEKK